MNKITNIKSNAFNKISFISMAFSLATTCTYASGDVTQNVVSDLNSGNGVYGTIGQIMGILALLAFAIAVIKILQIGMMIMLGAGGGKSRAKESLIPWLIGAAICILFGTIGPWVIGIIMSGSSGGVFDI